MKLSFAVIRLSPFACRFWLPQKCFVKGWKSTKPLSSEVVAQLSLKRCFTARFWTTPAERSGDGSFGRVGGVLMSKDFRALAKAVSRCACHRSWRRILAGDWKRGRSSQIIIILSDIHPLRRPRRKASPK
jgi:hypothetical protein